MMRVACTTLLTLMVVTTLASADPPSTSYLFPAGGRQGTTVDLRVGGINLHKTCNFEMLGPGLEAPKQLQRTRTPWFEGPMLEQPDSQRQEDYPKDMLGQVKIAADAPLGVRFARVWTSQGGTSALKFVVGDLPEIIEQEIDGDPVPVPVTLPLTINGRIFPREDIDIWSFDAVKGQSIVCEVDAARIGSPLDSLLQVFDAQGRKLAENDDGPGGDSRVRFVAPADGKVQVRIQDVNLRGGQNYVYRLTVTADPYIERTYPLGGKRGAKVRFELAGQGLPSEPAEIALPGNGPRDHVQRLTLAGKKTNLFLLDLDDLAEHLEKEPNDQAEQVKPLEVPAVFNGRIDRPGDSDVWTFAAKKGDVYEIELRAGKLGSPLAGVLTVSDAAGKEVSRAEAGVSDPSVRFTAPADGTYAVRVAERFRARGGPEYAYRLRIAKPALAGFKLRLAPDARQGGGGGDAVTVERGGQGKLKLGVERSGGFAGPIALTVEGLPEGVTASPAAINGNQPTVDIVFKASATAAIRARAITIRGAAKVGEQMQTVTAVLPATTRGLPEIDSVLLAVAMPTPFKVVGEHDFRWAPRGTVHRRSYKIERKGYDGPIEVKLADHQARHLQGATGPTIVVPAGVSEFDYGVSLPPWMEMGRTCRVAVMASAVLKDADGSEHTVSFTSIQANDQVIVVVGPERLSLEAGKTALVALPGKTVQVPVRITRGKGLQGPVKLELIPADHMRGVAADLVTIPADQATGQLVVRFAGDMKGPWNTPLVLRATILDMGQPVIDEVKLEVREP